MATFLFGGAEGVLAQAPGHALSAVCVYPGARYRQFAPFLGACGKAAARICKTTQCTVELPRARARGLFLGRVCRTRGAQLLRCPPIAGGTLFWYELCMPSRRDVGNPF